ncbi:electron transfer flavoprotein subunit beta/FixA family protein [Cryobacterium glaciale]|uniref:Electron transfer flavoprotein subunit beta n=1 Tax=Cryobacterium glaciale TaxID=1259145 RepID=A0A4R8V528_9MICO|nr:electron transfer flavoprotein subunit beta/FixA family protein [Cryobacterium glaciale]TFB77312.1 electron transfer flavoprotein subunit beta/FixA family protein [Cryobacterium glaciale]
MKIIVLVKEVPDTYGERKLDTGSGYVDRGASAPVLDEISEKALEAAVSYRDKNSGAEVIAVSMGPSSVAKSLRKALAIGATSAVHVSDDGLGGADLTWTASVLAATVKKIGFDLIIAGNESTDGRGGVIPAMIAEHLGIAQLTSLNSVEFSDTEISGVRAAENATFTVTGTIPAIVSLTEANPAARFPSFKGVMTAKRKPLDTWSLADLRIEAASLAGARTVIVSVSERPAKSGGLKIVDDGDAGTRLADFLATRGFH